MLELIAAVLKGLGYATAFSSAGTVLARTTLQQGKQPFAGLNRFIRIAAAMLAICAGLTAYVFVLRLGGGLDAAMIQAVVFSPLGVALALQLGGAVAIAASPARKIALPGALAVLLAFGLVGHASTRGLLTSATVVLHVSAAAWWFGGLCTLMLAMHSSGSNFVALLQCFSRQAIRVVILLVFAALVTASLLLEFQLDIARTYDRGLIAKAALTLGLLALAVINRLVLSRRLAAGADATGRLHMTILAEICLFAAIFAVTAWLTNWQSPHAAVHGDHDVQASGPITIVDPWAPAMPGGLGTGAGYMVILNNQQIDDRLLSASSPWAEHVSLHVSTLEGTISRMRNLDGLAVPAHGKAEFAQGHNHLMFTGLYAPFVAGDVVPVTLEFERAGNVHIVLHVRPLGYTPEFDHDHR